MAKTNQKDLDALEPTPKANEKIKTEKVKILGMLRGDYGAYDEGDIAELPEKVAKALIAEGCAAAYKETDKPAEETKEEEF